MRTSLLLMLGCVAAGSCLACSLDGGDSGGKSGAGGGGSGATLGGGGAGGLGASGGQSGVGASGGTASGGSAGAAGSASGGTGTAGAGGGGSGGGGLGANAKIIFLHHSTGGVIWGGGVDGFISSYNGAHGTSYQITEKAFPDSPYPWENYPYDYWNIWIAHAGAAAYQNNPTLEMLAPSYDVIVWKHCFPVSGIGPNTGSASVSSSDKTLENYQLQYAALKTKMLSFPNTRFIVWTGAALKESETNSGDAQRAKHFFDWVKGTWDVKGDNIFVWDFWQLETGGGLYLTDGNASGDSHPNETFAKTAAPLFGKRVIDVIEGRGDTGSLTGE